MAKAKAVRSSKRKDAERESRIHGEIIADSHDADERAMGWYYYLQDTLTFPFDAYCCAKRAISPLHVKDLVEVFDMAPEDECGREMFVMIRWEKDAVVPTGGERRE